MNTNEQDNEKHYWPEADGFAGFAETPKEDITSKATARPWMAVCVPVYEFGADSPRYNFEIRTPDGSKIALLGQNKEANAVLIYRAVNSHDALVEALKNALTDAEQTLTKSERIRRSEHYRKALALAGVKV